jgi:hypothetical protein
MRRARPLTDETGEVRELLLEDIKQFRPLGNMEAIYRALLDEPRASNDEVAKRADQYAGKQVSVNVAGNRGGELRWILRELVRRGWLTSQAAEHVRSLIGN